MYSWVAHSIRLVLHRFGSNPSGSVHAVERRASFPQSSRISIVAGACIDRSSLLQGRTSWQRHGRYKNPDCKVTWPLQIDRELRLFLGTLGIDIVPVYREFEA